MDLGGGSTNFLLLFKSGPLFTLPRVRRRHLSVLAAGALLLAALTVRSAPEAEVRSVGLARVDITPDYPVRLSGYAARKRRAWGFAHDCGPGVALGSDGRSR
jgi:hypothetical protein